MRSHRYADPHVQRKLLKANPQTRAAVSQMRLVCAKRDPCPAVDYQGGRAGGGGVVADTPRGRKACGARETNANIHGHAVASNTGVVRAQPPQKPKA